MIGRAHVFVWPVVMLCAGALSGCGWRAKGLNAEAARVFQQGDYQTASKKFLQAMSVDPTNADSYYNLATTMHRYGKLTNDPKSVEQAENYYNQCLEHNGDHVECYRGLAVLLAETGRSDAAFRLMDGWQARNPASAEPKIELARLLQEYGDQESAKLRLQEALAVQPNNSRALAALGKLREEAGDPMQALTNYQRSLAANRFQPQIEMRMAALQNTYTGAPAAAPPATDSRVVNRGFSMPRY